MRRSVVLALIAASWLSPASGAEPSPEFRANLKRTIELRKQSRRSVQPIGAIVPYPFPPALIIRHQREVHDEVGAFLDALRRSGG
jgi:hypothetical protein